MKVVGERWVVHVLGRTALPGYVFGPKEKEAFRKLLWKVSDFCGIGVLTYCLMGNHYHLLLDCPAPHDVPDDERHFFRSATVSTAPCPLDSGLLQRERGLP